MEMAVQSGKSMLKNKKGLTLIELLAVLVIVGIIAAIAIPAIDRTIDRSEDRADRASQQVVVDAATRYAIEENLSSSSTAAQLTRTIVQLHTDGYLNAEPRWNKAAHAVTSVTISFTANGTINVAFSAGTTSLLP